MPLTEATKKHICALAQRQVQPTNGMEVHFVNVVNGNGRACTPVEIEWLTYWNELKYPWKSQPVKRTAKSSSKKNKRKKSKKSTSPIQKNKSTANGTFAKNTSLKGYCIECGSKIPEARLIINPNVKCCVNCQSEIEEKSPGSASRKIDEGIGGTREDNKRMRAKNWGDMMNRGK